MPFFTLWSRPVHLWLLTHVYVPLRHSCALPRAVAAACVFAASSALHELTLLVPFKVLLPINTASLMLGAAMIPKWSRWFGAEPTANGQKGGVTFAAVVFVVLANLGQLQFAWLMWLSWRYSYLQK
jgi:MBOAT, membrane-bound O-acyltransferase family